MNKKITKNKKHNGISIRTTTNCTEKNAKLVFIQFEIQPIKIGFTVNAVYV